MTTSHIAYDRDAHAVYIQLTDGQVAMTVELSDTVYVDIDGDGEPVGFEILNADPSLLARIPELSTRVTLRELLSHVTP